VRQNAREKIYLDFFGEERKPVKHQIGKFSLVSSLTPRRKFQLVSEYFSVKKVLSKFLRF
jgi:hypothetical protein